MGNRGQKVAMLAFELNLSPHTPPQQPDDHQEQNGEKCPFGDHHHDPATVLFEKPLPDLSPRPNRQAVTRLGEGDAGRPITSSGDNLE